MVHTPVIPDRDIIHRLPPQAHLEVVVLDNQLREPVQEVLALLLGQAVDALDVVADGKDRLPARDRVRADHGVDRLEHLADVLRRAALLGVDGEAVALGRVVEGRLGGVGRQSVEEAAEGDRDAVVELVARGPESVYGGLAIAVYVARSVSLTTAGLGQLSQAQQGVVAGDGLEGDVRVPLGLVALAVLGAEEVVLEAVRVDLLGLDGRDDADLVVLAAELAAGVADGVDVQARGGGLARELAEAVDELLLQVVGQVVLGAEEDDAALGDCGSC